MGDTSVGIVEAPSLDEYRKAFSSFKPKDPQALLPPNGGVEQAEELFAAWRAGAPQNAVAFVGVPGSGCCVTLEALQRKFGRQASCTVVALDRYSIAHDGLAGALGAALGSGRSAGTDALIKILSDAEPRVVFLGGCHNLFVRRVKGFDTLYDLHHLFSSTRGRVLWVTQWSPYTWHFLDRTIGFSDYFDQVVRFGRLPADVLGRWLRSKHEATGLAVEFETPSGAPRLREGSWMPDDHRGALERAAGGNLVAASTAWLHACSPGAAGGVRVGMFQTFDAARLERCTEEDCYILASLLIHREIALGDLAEDMNLPELDTRMRLDHLRNRSVVTHDGATGQLSIEPMASAAVVDLLRKRNLIDVKELDGH